MTARRRGAGARPSSPARRAGLLVRNQPLDPDMDALALLCNLHADGPTTLRRLRKEGVDSLEAVARTPTEQLAELLGAPPAFARRFAREGMLLAERLLDPEPEEEPVSTGVATAVGQVPAPGPRRAEGPSEPEAAPGDVLLSHREEPPVASPRPPARLATHAAPGDGAAELLRPGLLEGLDRRLCEQLIAQGVRTLSALVDSAGLPLARRVGLTLPRLLDLAYRASERLRAGIPPSKARRDEPSAQPAPLPPAPAATEVPLRTVELVPRPPGGGTPEPARPPLSPTPPTAAEPTPTAVSPAPGAHDLEEPDAAGPFA